MILNAFLNTPKLKILLEFQQTNNVRYSCITKKDNRENHSKLIKTLSCTQIKMLQGTWRITVTDDIALQL